MNLTCLRMARSLNQFLCVRSDHLVKLAREFWDTDRVLFARGLMPRDWLLVSELADCAGTRMWESHMVSVKNASNVLVASDGSGGSRDHSHVPETGRILSGHLLFANPQWLICRQRIGFPGGQVPGRQVLGQSSGEPFKLPVVLSKRPTSRCEVRDERGRTKGCAGIRAKWRLVIKPVSVDCRAQRQNRCHQGQVTLERRRPISNQAKQNCFSSHARRTPWRMSWAEEAATRLLPDMNLETEGQMGGTHRSQCGKEVGSGAS